MGFYECFVKDSAKRISDYQYLNAMLITRILKHFKVNFKDEKRTMIRLELDKGDATP